MRKSEAPAGPACSVALPEFLLRKLYRKGSLRETAPGAFAFTLHNPLGDATLVEPPRIVVNGILFPPERVEAGVALESISPLAPFPFRRGDRLTLRFQGHLLRGGNRIHIKAMTKEWGELSIYAEDRPAESRDDSEE